MPLIDLNDAANWSGAKALYTGHDSEGQLVTLQRDGFRDGFALTADLIVQALAPKGLQKGQRIVVVGAQFGWFAERLVELGYGPMADGTANGKVGAVDTSAWIQSNLADNATVQIVNANVTAATGRQAIKQLFGSSTATIDWCIDYMILTCLVGAGNAPAGNNEIVPYCSSLRQLATNVAHCVTPLLSGPPSQDSRMNWKSIAAWKTWVGTDYVIEEGTDIIQ